MHALVFELNSIQSYLFSSGRLRDVAGASELLDQMTDGDGNLLDNVLNALGMDKKTMEFSRRAGGAIYAFCNDRDELMRFLRLWTLAVQQWAPGIDFSLGVGEGGTTHAEAFEAARRAMKADANRKRPNLPLASPLATRSRRTGQPADGDVSWESKDGPMDAATARKKQMADLSRAGFLKRFAPEVSNLGWRDWPTDLEGESAKGAFPFSGDDRTVALIHADGNGLGQLLMHIRDAAKENDSRFVELFSAFSKAVAATTQSAAQQATKEILLPVRRDGECLAARPILLGGDDITVIIRADLAMNYCRVFSEAFESASRKELAKLGKDHQIKGLPQRLTLGFGLVFLRASQPFHMAIHLVEALVGEAKKKAKALNQDDPESSIAFYRITGSLVDDYGQIVARALSHRFGDETFIDTLGVYYFKEQQPRLVDMLELAKTLGADDMARGPTRQLMTLMGHDKAQAERRYRRWRQLMADERTRKWCPVESDNATQERKKKSCLEQYDELMKKLAGISKDAPLPYSDSDDGIRRSPLGDALALLSLMCARSTTDTQKEQAA